MSVARVRAYRRGVLAETLAALIFRLKGYRIVAQRYRSPSARSISWRRKANASSSSRSSGKSKDDAAWTLPAKQRRRIVRAAQYWLASHPDFTSHTIAFDVVLAAPWSWPRHIENAFPV
jgi:putative endonuclease